MLQSTWGRSPSDVIVARRDGTILPYDGCAWSTVSSAMALKLASAWGSSSRDVFVVGDSGTVLHYDGTSWAIVSSGSAF
jgi:hypothetical protein